MYAMVVHCPLVTDFNILKNVTLNEDVTLQFPPSQKQCAGAPSVQDLQLSSITPANFSIVSDATPIFV